MAILYLILAFTLNSLANVLLKLRAVEGVAFTGSLVEIVTKNLPLLFALGVFVVNVIFYFLALRSLPLSFAYPIMTIMSFLLINGYAIAFLHEPVSEMQILGYLLVLAGVVLISAFGVSHG